MQQINAIICSDDGFLPVWHPVSILANADILLIECEYKFHQHKMGFKMSDAKCRHFTSTWICS